VQESGTSAYVKIAIIIIIIIIIITILKMAIEIRMFPPQYLHPGSHAEGSD
jgi:hypothetical protein